MAKTYYTRTINGYHIIAFKNCEYRGVILGAHEFLNVRKALDKEFVTRIPEHNCVKVTDNIENLFDFYVVQSNNDPRKSTFHTDFNSAMNAADLNGFFKGECSIYGTFWTNRGLMFGAKFNGDFSDKGLGRMWAII